jgi:hypothetical protein
MTGSIDALVSLKSLRLAYSNIPQAVVLMRTADASTLSVLFVPLPSVLIKCAHHLCDALPAFSIPTAGI